MLRFIAERLTRSGVTKLFPSCFVQSAVIAFILLTLSLTLLSNNQPQPQHNYNYRYFICLQAGDPNVLFAHFDNKLTSLDAADIVFEVEYPFKVPDELSNGFPFSAYAAKAHPELSKSSGEIVFSYNTNSNGGFEGLTNSTVGYVGRASESCCRKLGAKRRLSLLQRFAPRWLLSVLLSLS